MIGVFDSGIGGLSVLKALRAAMPHESFIYLADSAHAPYGERDEAHVSARTRAAARYLLREHGVKALVVACNTATAAAIHELREAHPALPIVGVEPALKPALALSRTGRIAVLATRGTLASDKFMALHDGLARQAEFVLTACDGLAHAIEHSIAAPAQSEAELERLCAAYLAASGPFGQLPGQVDTLVLGCTHYPFASERLQRLAGSDVRLIDTGDAVARQTRRLLEAAGQLSGPDKAGRVELLTTGEAVQLVAAAHRWLAIQADARSVAV